MRLYLCEKPSQGKDIARVLGAAERGEGCYRSPTVVVTWCVGHLVQAAAPEAYGEQYRRWTIEQLPIIPQRWTVLIKSSTAQQFSVVRKLLQTATEVVIATDADREGEMIAREVLDLCAYRGPVQRLWLSALNEASICQALAALRPGHTTLPLYHAALARSRADWLIGMNLSRLFTLLGQRAGYRGVLSVGRVQTPTLHLVVQRDREIAHFVPVPFWSIAVALSAHGLPFTGAWLPPKAATDEAGRCISERAAKAAMEELRHAREAQVTSVSVERVREGPPLPFDLSTLQEVCSRQLALDVQETLNIAQALYETHKAITYPRSDSGYLPESMLADVPRVLAALLASDPSIRPLLGTLDRTRRSRAWNDTKVTAHHGIIPTLEATHLAAMSATERAVYELIRAHYLAQFLPDHEYDRTKVRLSCVAETLEATGKQVKMQGWRSVLRAATDGDPSGHGPEASQVLPTLAEGHRCSVARVELKAQTTQPPKPYTQGELIKAMKGIARWVNDPQLKQKLKDTTGIGTEATRAGIIQGLIARGYLSKAGRALRAAPSAFALIDAIPPAIADPGTTALWEQALDAISKGLLPLDEFVSKQEAWVRQLVRDYAARALSITPHTDTRTVRSATKRRSRRGRPH